MAPDFAWPWLFALLPLPLLALLLPRAQVSRPAALRFPFFEALEASTTARERRSKVWRLSFALLAWLLLVVAAARPQLIGETVYLPVAGRSLMLAVDISGSMQTDDMRIGGQRMTRLTAVKEVAGEFIEQREGDRVGLILFGDQAYLQAPLTFDRRTVNTLLDEAAIGLAGRSTAIGDAIGLAVKRLQDQPEENRILILMTDGANTAGAVSPLKAADLAATANVRIYTIGIGASERIVRGLFGNRRLANRELDEKTLRAIADKTGGRYFRARDAGSLADIYALLDEIEPVSEDTQSYRPVDELYAWPLAGSLLLTLLMVLFPQLAERLRAGRVQNA
jgi:Ca-activated chloride channel family protein